MKNILSIGIVTVILLSILSSSASANLIRNPSFVGIPGPNGPGIQGILPSDWVIANVTPDTYSNDGSYGLLPTDFGNFSNVFGFSVLAKDGIRWVAGWSEAGQERFGQILTTNLVNGTEYEFSGWLHQALRGDLDNPGGYGVWVTNDASENPVLDAGELLGYLGNTTSSNDGWVQFSFNFTANANHASRPFLMFAPLLDPQCGTPNNCQGAYPGLDLVSLTAVAQPDPCDINPNAPGCTPNGIPEPGMLALFVPRITGAWI